VWFVIYETPDIREHALKFCDRIAEEEKSALVREMNWWSFSLLGNPMAAGDAARKAAEADMVVFAMEADGDLPEKIKLWIESWLNRRGEREGALVGLLSREERPQSMAPFREIICGTSR